MNELIEHYWKRMLLFVIPYLAFFFLAFVQIPYYVDTPGGLTEVENLISVDYNEDKVTEGSISSTYIMAITRPTYMQFIFGTLDKYSTIGILSGSSATYTNNEIIQISYLDKAISVDSAILVAYQKAALDNPEINIDYRTAVMVFGKAAYLSHYDDIEFGDVFVSVLGDDDTIVTEISGISAATQDSDTYAFTLRNDEGNLYTVDLTKSPDTGLFGITFKTYYILDEETVYPKFTVQNSNIGGPSGGLLQTLSIYNMLVDEDITHGLKIAGTGTINPDGSVGYIGGEKQKIATAYLNHVDVFFMPHIPDAYGNYPSYDNYEVALAACEELGIDPEGWLIPVASVDDALDYLAGLGD